MNTKALDELLGDAEKRTETPTPEVVKSPDATTEAREMDPGTDSRLVDGAGSEDVPDVALPAAVMPAGTKKGQKKVSYDDESTVDVLKKAKSLIRTDWGGEEANAAIKKKLAERGVDAGPAAVEAIRQIVEAQVEACRKRVSPRFDESIRRAGGSPVLEVLP